MLRFLTRVSLWGAVIRGATTRSCSNGLPIIDLGYEIHQALDCNQTTDIYAFSNIRYAQAPVGDLRFRAPLFPTTNRTAIQNGTGLRVCPQGIPAWQGKATPAIAKFASSTDPFNVTNWEETIANSNFSIPSVNAVSSEDCLFLDVYVPGKVLSQRGKRSSNKTPVLVWIHGGGYVLGSKTGYPNQNFDPAGLLQHGNNDFIFVTLNYRLGALGFLPGPQVRQDGNLNVAILDQRFALEWVQRNIHLFGGSANRVTVMGESGGAGTILAHLAQEKTPFAQIIAQSPAISSALGEPEDAFSGFMAALNVSNLVEARKASSDAIIAANAKQIGAAPANTYIYGPVQDDSTIPIPVLRSFQEGRFNKDVKMMIAHNSFEGSFFFDPTVKTEADFKSWILRSIPGLSTSQADHLVGLYPPVFDGSVGYIDQDTRQTSLWGEALFDCNFLYANMAKEGNSFAYEFSVSPGMHTQDLPYTFAGNVLYPQVRDTMQQAIASFVLSGTPSITLNGKARQFPQWGSSGTLVNLTSAGAVIGSSRINQTRCAWWASL